MDRPRPPTPPIKSSMTIIPNGTVSTSSPATPVGTSQDHANGAAAGAGTTSTTTGPSGIPGTQDLWGSILDSVSSSRNVSTKNCIVLGSASSGKTTLVDRLASATGQPSSSSSSDPSSSTTNPTGTGTGTGTGTTTNHPSLDVGLSYSVLDVRDEADEDTVARMGIYQLPSHKPPYPSLLSLALSRSTLLDSLVVVVLDWESPHSFLRELGAWIEVLTRVAEQAAANDTWEAVTAKERVEAHVRSYHEPTPSTTAATTSASANTSTTAQVPDHDSPLPAGVLDQPLGLPLVIVCTKSDQIDTLEREMEFKEEQCDFVQQALRTVCLKYGAALFFTSHSRPMTFARLRSYILHRLFSPPPTTVSAPTALGNQADEAGSVPTSTLPLNAVGSALKAFPFNHRANVVDREEVLVPSGWDSWGKIRVLRDRFDPEAFSRAWDDDVRSGLGEVSTRGGAVAMYEDIVVDVDEDSQPTRVVTNHVEAMDEQDFLKPHYETLQADRVKDPRAAFAARPGDSGAMNGMSNEGGFGGSVVGPMSSAVLSLPSVERALGGGGGGAEGLGSEGDNVSARLAKMVQKDSGQGSAEARGSALPSSGMTSPTSLGNAGASSLPSGTGATAGGQNEVLANFFQSLLAARSSTTPSGGATGSANNASPSHGSLGASTRGGA
ncbi:BQ5605_C003g01898 [Microbotryum silenes-dioicae]|uniref:BQ5605_C003g01898 protein n=1 Tax=Microbotryum silenes-dioicae TaxID=796604 RepID=A0A2X0M025_9BASI|nr:BQ5605_C003g01898 [Microbotryum silenes-dioicae]